MPTIGRLLVANRSEIAVRVFRACKELGITSIAIYSEIDRDAFHLGFADEAYYVGETPPPESYLNIGRIVEAARKARADAVHPGYGFLAENPTFAQAVLDAGLTWVGPPPAAIRAMGDKVSARKVADEAWHIGETTPAKSYLNVDALVEVARRSRADAVHPGYGFLAENAAFAQAVMDAGLRWVGPKPAAIAAMGDKVSARRVAEQAKAPLVPGTVEPVSGPEAAIEFGGRHGYPLALKAAFGGGGRGMKVVSSADDVVGGLESARRESKAAFGRDEIYAERYLDAPRHVEAQVLADGRGEVVFLGERDCSLQRRHQKLVEEAPAPGLPEEVRVALGKAACDIARAADYENAGTIEFLYEPTTHKFYFLEMNTRLQVEHPVTELTAGIDLVHAQLRVAAGEGIPAAYDGVVARGHAIEARINAEDPGARFMPAPGLITGWREPSGPGVRVDAGVRAGFTVPQAYDSLLAKLIVWGEDRDQARRRMLRALDEFQIEGVPTTIPFHRLAMRDPAFVAGEVSTVLVEQGMDLSSLEPVTLDGAGPPTAKPPPRRLVIELEGKRFDVDLFPQEQVKVPERIRTPRSEKALERA
ncbi:MAG TPA: biotin carboxylase N-terminal domain-containing protein, partial [Actinomycetes bacterium]|nr:biotin carboxylase N-terminal domain-containing protein [Actinomycetes bacterium]